MTKIDFAINAPDKLHYVCRVARKKYAEGSPLVVYCSQPRVLAELDRRLWDFSALDFLPHCYASDPLAARTPIILTASASEAPDALPHYQLLINLDQAWPPFFSRFERLIELVGHEEEDKAAGRQRYKFYKDRGYELTHHDLGST
jgi:DNA polymerase-3 subunit chi